MGNEGTVQEKFIGCFQYIQCIAAESLTSSRLQIPKLCVDWRVQEGCPFKNTPGKRIIATVMTKGLGTGQAAMIPFGGVRILEAHEPNMVFPYPKSIIPTRTYSRILQLDTRDWKDSHES